MAELLIGPPIVMIVKSDRKPPEPVHVIDNKIREGLYPLSGALKQYPESSLPAYLARQRLVTDAIQPYLYADENGDLTKESPTRDTRVRKVETLLEPYEPDLIEIVRRSASQPVVQDPNVDLILYIHPSNRVSQVLREIATSPNTRPDRAAQAFNYLFMLRLDDATLRQQVIEIIASRGERTARTELGDILLQRAASDWGMEEMMPRYLDFLSIPFRPENYPTTNARVALLAQYCASATGLQSMEGEGIAYTALIEARVAEMNPAESDQANFIHQAKATLDILRKKRPANTLVNWKGQLLGISAKFGRRP